MYHFCFLVISKSEGELSPSETLEKQSWQSGETCWQDRGLEITIFSKQGRLQECVAHSCCEPGPREAIHDGARWPGGRLPSSVSPPQAGTQVLRMRSPAGSCLVDSGQKIWWSPVDCGKLRLPSFLVNGLLTHYYHLHCCGFCISTVYLTKISWMLVFHPWNHV